MKINKRTIRYVLKHTDSTIDDLIKWFKGWKVRKHGDEPCNNGHMYLGRFSFYCVDKWFDHEILIKLPVVGALDIHFFANKYVKDKQFRTEFLAELEKIRGEFE